MKSVYTLTPDELAAMVGSVFAANGLRADSVSIKMNGQLVNWDQCEVSCQGSALKVRCTPETDPYDAMRNRYQQMFGQPMPGTNTQQESQSDGTVE